MFDKSKYPADWKQISLARREAAGWKCEWCGIEQGSTATKSGKPVVLTVAHIGPNRHDKMDCSGLVALCQKCHLAYDLPDHIAHARETRMKRRAVDSLFAQEG